MSSISLSLQYDKDQSISFTVGAGLSASAYKFLHSNRRNGPFVQETVSTTVTSGKLIIVLPKALINTFGEQEYYQITANGNVIFDGDIYVAIPKTLPEAMVTIEHISDATDTGKSLLRATDSAAARTAIGAGVSNVVIGTTAGTAKAGDYAPTWSDVTSKPTTFTPAAHTHTTNDISDATTTGKSVITAASAAAARTAIGAGTSNIALGTTSSTAKAGDYQPAVANITDATTIGKAILLAADGAAVRSLTGAGVSNLVIGTTSSTAKAGDYVPTWNEITSKPTTFAPAAHTHVIADITDSVPVTKLSSTGATSGQVLTYNGTTITWTTVAAGGSAADATTTAKGIVQLAGDLAGTADAPTVPGLATKANLTGAAFTGNVTSTAIITAQNGGAGMVQVGASTGVPMVRLGLSSGPNLTSSNTSGGAGGVQINGSTATSVALSVRGFTGQSSNLQDWRIGTGSPVAQLTAAGLFVTTSLRVTGTASAVGQYLGATDTSGNVGFITPTKSFAKVIHGSDASVVRPANTTYVLWQGSVQPTNWIDGDDWNQTA